MKKNIVLLIILLISFSMELLGQNDIENVKMKEELILANPQLLHNIVVVTDKQGNANRGFLIGLKADTILFSRQNEQYRYSLKDLISVTIDVEPSNTKGLLIGGVIGAYIANIAILRAEYQTFAYMSDHELWRSVIFSFLFGAAGGSIGYLIEANSAKVEIDFIFSDDQKKWESEFERFRRFIMGTEKEKLLHISIQLSQVSTRLSELADAEHYYYYDVTNFNLMRKFDITYSVFNKINLGLAICWFGEPSFEDWSFEELNYTSILVQQKYEGIGYYAVGTYEPFQGFSPDVSWKFGLGIGLGNIDYHLNTLKENYIEGEYLAESFETKISKNIFSGILYTNLDFYLNNVLSLGFSADYVYLAKTMPAIPELNVGKSNFGNYSLGINISLNF